MTEQMSAEEFRKRFKTSTDKALNQDNPKNTPILGGIPKYKNIKCEYNNIIFDSILEKDFYILLQNHKIPFILKENIILQPSFKFKDETVRAITWTPDFYIPKANLYIDTKEYSNDTFPLKLKMFKNLIVNEYKDYKDHDINVSKKNYPTVFVFGRKKLELAITAINLRLQGKENPELEEILLFKRNKK